MGQEDRTVTSRLKPVGGSPKSDQIDIILFGPGYGECVLLHIGNENWVIVDSCINDVSRPVALAYLRDLGLNPAEAVRLIVATHWHDDHIRGMGRVVEVCDKAIFCCASALCKEEFLAAVGEQECNPTFQTRSGTQEFHKVLSLLQERSSRPKWAIANRRLFTQDGCEVWALSPFDKDFGGFLQEVGRLLPKKRETKRPIPSLTPNKVAVVLLIQIGETIILLGSDLERQGWLEILDADEWTNRKASVFKIPHHGSKTAHEDRVWNEMLHNEPIAMLTPWRKGKGTLPTKSDMRRIISFTRSAYATVPPKDVVRKSKAGRDNAVKRTIRETDIEISRVSLSRGVIRLRKKSTSQADWGVETFGLACRLKDCRS